MPEAGLFLSPTYVASHLRASHSIPTNGQLAHMYDIDSKYCISIEVKRPDAAYTEVEEYVELYHQPDGTPALRLRPSSEPLHITVTLRIPPEYANGCIQAGIPPPYVQAR